MYLTCEIGWSKINWVYKNHYYQGNTIRIRFIDMIYWKNYDFHQKYVFSCSSRTKTHELRAATRGKTNKTAVLPGFCKYIFFVYSTWNIKLFLAYLKVYRCEVVTSWIRKHVTFLQWAITTRTWNERGPVTDARLNNTVYILGK